MIGLGEAGSAPRISRSRGGHLTTGSSIPWNIAYTCYFDVSGCNSNSIHANFASESVPRSSCTNIVLLFSLLALKSMRVFIDAKFARPSSEISAYFFFKFASDGKFFNSRTNFASKWAWHSSCHFPSHLFSVEKKLWLAWTRDKLLRILGRVRTYMFRA